MFPAWDSPLVIVPVGMQFTELNRDNGSGALVVHEMERFCPQIEAADFKGARPSNSRRAIQVDGKFLLVNGQRFWIKGVTYGTFSPNEEGEPYPPLDQVRVDFEQMRRAGVNTVRLYTPPSTAMAD